MPTSEYVKVFSDCILVTGAKNNALYDLTRKKFEIFNLEQAEWFQDLNLKKYKDVKRLSSKNKEYGNFIDFLFEREFIFLCLEDELQYFPELKKEWFHPSKISNLILIQTLDSDESIFKYLNDLESLGLLHVQIFLLDKVSNDRISKLLSAFSKLSIKSIELFSRYDIAKHLISSSEFYASNKLITVTITNCKKFQLINKSSEIPFNILFLKNDIKEIFENRFVDSNYFTVDIRLYTEALTYNTFFNRKIIVDEKNNILKALTGDTYFNLADVDMAKLVETVNFQKLWKVKKDDIKICQDCEFRYMCVDSREPILKEGEWTFENGCDYDPYSGVWK